MGKEEKIKKIEEALKSIRPYMQFDEGDIEFVELTQKNIVKYRFSGTCKDCNLKMQTAMAIEKHLKKFIPDLNGAEEVD